MIVTTSNKLEKYNIIDDGIVLTSTCHYGMGFLTVIVEVFAHIFGFENGLLEKKLEKSKTECISDLKEIANRGNYNALINLKFSISGMTLMVTAQAVKVAKIKDNLENQNIKTEITKNDGILVIQESEFVLNDSKIKYNNCFYNLSGIKNLKISGNSVLFTLLGSDYKVIITSGYERVKEIFNLLNQYVDKEE